MKIDKNFAMFIFQDMLFRRTLKLVEFDTASKNAEKAKPPKKNWVRIESSAYKKCSIFPRNFKDTPLHDCFWSTTKATAIDIHGGSQTSYTVPCNGVISHGLKLGVFGFLRTKNGKTDAKPMRPRSLRTMQRLSEFYRHAQTAVDAGDMRTWRTVVILIMGKTRRPPIWAPCWNQDGAGFGISCVYLSIIYGYCSVAPCCSKHRVALNMSYSMQVMRIFLFILTTTTPGVHFKTGHRILKT